MSAVEDGGPAFPVQAGFFVQGMTIRDWFAGQALAAMGVDPAGWNKVGWSEMTS